MPNKVIKIERLPFFMGIARILSDIEGKSFQCKQSMVNLNDYEISPGVIISDLTFNVVEILSPNNENSQNYESLYNCFDIALKSFITNQKKSDEYISFSHALNVIKDLRLLYGYLNDFMKIIKKVAIDNQGILNSQDIENIINNYNIDPSIMLETKNNNGKILYLHSAKLN